MTGRRLAGGLLLALAAMGALASVHLTRTPPVPQMVANLVLDRFSFIYQGELDDKPFLTGLDTKRTRVEFRRMTAYAQRAWIGRPDRAGETPVTWTAVPSRPLTIDAAPGGGAATFKGVRLNRLGIERGTVVALEHRGATALKVLLAGRRAAATITYPGEVLVECEHCRVQNEAAAGVVFFRLRDDQKSTVTVEGDTDLLTLGLDFVDGNEFERGLALTDPRFVVTRGTVEVSSLRRETVTIPAKAQLELVSADAAFKLTSLSVRQSGLEVTLQAPVSRIAVNGDTRYLHQLAPSWTTLTFLLAGTGLALVSGAWLILKTPSRRQTGKTPREVIGRQSPGGDTEGSSRTGETSAPATGGNGRVDAASDPSSESDTKPTPEQEALLEAADSSEIFLSYSSTDRAIAERVAHALIAQGRRVWWDVELLAGTPFAQAIETALHNTGCVVVLWSATSIKSHWVLAEASEALERNVLVPVLIERVRPPLQFRALHMADLVGWSEDTSDPRFRKLANSVSEVLKRSAPRPGRPARAGSPDAHES